MKAAARAEGRPDRALATLRSAIEAGRVEPVYLIVGDRVLAEPIGLELARLIASPVGGEPVVHRRPPQLAPLLADLQTYALFEGAKVIVAVDTALFADRASAARLVDEAAEALPLLAVAPERVGDAAAVRRGARRLVSALRLFQVDPSRGTAAEAIAGLPDWALQGGGAESGGGRPAKGRKRRGGQETAELRAGLARLLEVAREEGIEAWAESELATLAAIVDRGLPEHHALVLVERAIAAGHPLVANLTARGAAVEVGQVTSQRGGGWGGLEDLAAQLAAETGTGIATEALEELARRTLRQGGWSGGAADADSTERFAAEYRKLATMVPPGDSSRIGRSLVDDAVQDRGEEDVWAILDAIGEGAAAGGLQRIERYLAAADDATAARLMLWGRLADFCRQLAAVGGVMKAVDVAPGERNYPRFRDALAPRLQAELPGAMRNPLAGLHPFRLHRAYLAASRLGAEALGRLPWRVLQTELRLKGESAEAGAALAALVTELAGAPRGGSRSSSAGRAAPRGRRPAAG